MDSVLGEGSIYMTSITILGLPLIDIIVIIAYFAVVLWIGFTAMGKTVAAIAEKPESALTQAEMGETQTESILPARNVII